MIYKNIDCKKHGYTSIDLNEGSAGGVEGIVVGSCGCAFKYQMVNKRYIFRPFVSVTSALGNYPASEVQPSKPWPRPNQDTIHDEVALDFSMYKSKEAPVVTNKYQKMAHDINGKELGLIDVYSVLSAFNVTEPGLQHAIKKLLMPGQRGKGSVTADLKEAIQSVARTLVRVEQEEARIAETSH